MDIIFATNNPHKAEEAGKLFGSPFHIILPSQLGFAGDIPETRGTIAENSEEKALFIWNMFRRICFADDTGLEIDALGGAPGVYSARYAGEGKNPADNRRKVLRELEGVPFERRTARFRCVVTLAGPSTDSGELPEITVFEGTCEGHIALAESEGVQGFGYDSIFIPNGMECTMAEISMEVKNALSHRGKAMRQLVNFLSAPLR